MQQSLNKKMLLSHPLRFGAATSYKTFSSYDNNNNQNRKGTGTSYYTLAASAGSVLGYLIYQKSKEN